MARLADGQTVKYEGYGIILKDSLQLIVALLLKCSWSRNTWNEESLHCNTLLLDSKDTSVQTLGIQQVLARRNPAGMEAHRLCLMHTMHSHPDSDEL